MTMDAAAKIPAVVHQEWRIGDLIARFTIPGEPAAKGNSREIVMIGGRPRLRKCDKALAFEALAGMYVPKTEKPYDGDVAVIVRVFYASRRPDVDASLVYDALQNKKTAAGIGPDGKRRWLIENRLIENDRQVRLKIESGFIDRDRPRVEVAVYEAVPSVSPYAWLEA
jgi:hypothetical protein